MTTRSGPRSPGRGPRTFCDIPRRPRPWKVVLGATSQNGMTGKYSYAVKQKKDGVYSAD
jgi:hypothetical protein